MRRSWIFACVVLLFTVASATAQTAVPATGNDGGSDWPQYGGPDQNSISPEKGLLREWPAGGPGVLWRAKISQGWGCPSVSGKDVVYAGTIWATGGWEHSDMETIVCLDTQSGKERWHYTYEIGGHYQQKDTGWPWGGVRATPTITEKYVYSVGVLGTLVCVDRKDGKLVWQRELTKEFWPNPHREWKGYCFSPAINNDVVIFPFCINEPLPNGDMRVGVSSIIGINAVTGKNEWPFELRPVDKKDEMARVSFFESAAFAKLGADMCAFYNYGEKIKAFRVSDGKEMWAFQLPLGNNGTIASVVVADKRIIVRPGPAVVEIDRKTAPFSARLLWSQSTSNNCASQNLLPMGDHLYGFMGGIDPNGVDKSALSLACIEYGTGKTVWEQKGFATSCSLIGADGLLFARSFQSLYLVEASPKGYVLKGKVEKLHDVTNAQGKDGGWVMPVLSRGKLFIRTPNELICYKVSKD